MDVNGYMMVYDDKRVVAMNSPFLVVESAVLLAMI